MRVLIAPQELKGSLNAAEAAQAIAAGIRRERPEWELDILPLSDGGPGLLEAMRRAVACDVSAAAVHDALGRPVLARYLLLPGGTVVIEAAQANGLMHLAAGERDALRADTAGVGELLLEGLESHPNRVIIGVGGSATTDGGAGMARALGARLLDERGEPLAPGGEPLRRLARIDWTRPAALARVEVVVATDVTNPLLGPSGAAPVYAPQKGASAADVAVLASALERYTEVVRRDLGVDIGAMEGGGAAGGLAAGLVAFCGARIASGFEMVARASGLDARLAAADRVVTGEGSFDGQSLQGKVTGRLLERARAAGKRCTVFAGRAEGGAGVEVRTIGEVERDSERAMTEAAPLLAELAARWAREQPEA